MLFLFFTKYLQKAVTKTNTNIDDELVRCIKKPFFIFVIVTIFYCTAQPLPLPPIVILWVNKTYYVATVITITLLLSRVISIFVAHGFRVQKRFEKTPKLLVKILSLVLYVIAFLMILSHFHIEITTLITTLGIGGLAVGLALQDTLSNFFAGLHILSDRPVRVGDFIELPGTDITGYVEDVGWRSTKIRTLPNQFIIVPNAKLAESIIINDSLPEHEISTRVQVGVSYESDLEKVERVTVEVAKYIQENTPGAVKSFEPFIRFHTFGDSNIDFTVILRVEKFVDKYLVIHEFIKALKARYDQENIEISWPVRKIYQAQ